MGNDFQISGASPAKQSRFAPLYNSTFSVGLSTQRNPLRPGNETALTNKIYGNKGDSLLDGRNVEISNRLTMVRRPGSSVYNSQTFPPIDNFYEFRLFDANSESIKVITDTSDVIYDATGPNTKDIIYTKSAGSGEAYFQSVGNNLYIGDGSHQQQVIGAFPWQANMSYALGTLILDSNGNLQQAFSVPSSLSITSIQQFDITGPAGSFNFVRIIFSTPVTFPSGFGSITLSGLSNATWLNGAVISNIAPIGTAGNAIQGTTTISHADYGPAADTGTATGVTTTGSGTSGSTEPIWSSSSLQLTVDNDITWRTFVPNTVSTVGVQSWGISGPASVPTSVALYSEEIYWQANTNFSQWQTVLDSNGQIQVVFGMSGPSGFNQPVWSTVFGGATQDGGVSWRNCGTPLAWLANTVFPLNTSILDTNGNIQVVTGTATPGQSGATQPSWATGLGSSTSDNNLGWTNCGPGVILSSGSVQYSFSLHSIDGSVSDLAPIDSSIVNGVLGSTKGYGFFINGERIGLPPFLLAYSSGTQIDSVWIWRTVQGGSIPLLLAQVPLTLGNSGPNIFGTWSYFDYLADSQLNPFIAAPLNGVNHVPPPGLSKMTYHLGRIWGVVNNTVYFSNGPDTTTGNGNTSFPPANVFVFPSKVTYLYASTLGLFVFTLSDVFIIQGTSTTTFFSAPFCTGLGLQNYNALTVNGNTIYMFTSDYQVVSLDLSSGVEEVGVNIGDQFLKNNWDANTVRLTWHIAGSPDKGLYVSDYSNGWFRLYPTPNPETGRTWAPFAEIVGGVSAVESVETSPGVHNLLIGPKTSGPILKRDDSVFTDNGQPYDANFTLGSIVVAQPGQLAELVFLTTDSIAIGVRPDIYAQLDEIAPFSSGMFDLLTLPVPDPPQLAPSVSMMSERLYFSSTQQPALGRSLQLYFDWGTQTVQNELLSLTVFGGYSSELA